MVFENDPLACTSESIARKVSAKIDFYDAETGDCISVHGRWAAIVERKGRTVMSSETLVDEIQINGTKELIVAIKDPDDGTCYGMSTDAFHEQALTFGGTGPSSHWIVKGMNVDAVIRIRGINVDQCFVLEFNNEGKATAFASVACSEVDPSFTYSCDWRRKKA